MFAPEGEGCRIQPYVSAGSDRNSNPKPRHRLEAYAMLHCSPECRTISARHPCQAVSVYDPQRPLQLAPFGVRSLMTNPVAPREQ